MPWKRIVPVLLLSLAVLGVSRPAASQSIDDAWALVDTCAELEAFKQRYGLNNRFAGSYAARARLLRCSARPPVRPPPPPPPPTSPQRPKKPPPPPPPQEAPLKARVYVDQSGHGDARTVTEALRKVRTNGEIVVRPGVYTEQLEIYASVTIRGEQDSAKRLPVIQAPVRKAAVVNVMSGQVRLENLHIRATADLPLALYVKAGSLTATSVSTEWAPSTNTPLRNLGTVQIETDEPVLLERVDLGPGAKATLVLIDARNVTVVGSRIRQPSGEGVIARQSVVSFIRTEIDAPEKALVAYNGSTVQMEFMLIRGAAGGPPPLSVLGDATVTIQSSVVCVSGGQAWFTADRRAGLSAAGVFNAEGLLISQSATDADYSQSAQAACRGAP